MRKRLGWGVKQNGYGDDSQHLNEDDVRECGYGVVTQSAHEHAHHDHRKNRDKPECDDVHYLKVRSGCDVRLVSDARAGDNAPNDLRRYNGVSKRANSDRPSDVPHRVVHHYVGGGNGPRDASADLRNVPHT